MKKVWPLRIYARKIHLLSRYRLYEDILKNTTLSSGSSLSWVVDYDEWNNDGYYDFLFVFDNGDQYVLDDVDLTDYDYFVQLYGDVDGADTTGE